MDIRKMKLDLTVALMNAGKRSNLLNLIKDIMLTFKEVGAYIGLRELNKFKLNPAHEKQTYVIQFENCTLDVELVANSMSRNQYVHGFQIR